MDNTTSASSSSSSGKAPAGACVVCGLNENEDEVLLCDNPGCSRETHMYCLRPPLLVVPEGIWFCEYCRPTGSEDCLLRHFQRLRSIRSSIHPRSERTYEAYLTNICYPIDRWIPTFSQRPGSEIGKDVITIGKKVAIWSSIDERFHMGRIISIRSRQPLYVLEPLVHFKR